eukprot:2871714-Ditylum_brightwellii.AAC.1
MQVGIFYLISDSTPGLVIHVGKAVMSALVIQVQLPTGENNPFLFKSWKKTNFPRSIRVLYGGLDPFAAQGHQNVDSVVTPDSISVSGID